MYKNLKHTLILGLVLTFSVGVQALRSDQGTLFVPMAATAGMVAVAPVVVPEVWKWTHNMLASFVNTAYFACVNSNNQNSDMSQWTIDLRTMFNIAWSGFVYGVTNKYESSFIPEQEAIAAALDPATQLAQIQAIQDQVKNAKWWINFVGSTSPMIALNSNLTMIPERYNQTKQAVKEQGFDESTSAIVGGALFALRNFGFFYIIPPLIKPINHMFFKKLWKANDLAEGVYSKIPSRALACATFSVMSLTYQELLISIKNLVNQFLPQPATPLSIARFDDCTRCWFGTNLFGKSGPVGKHLFSARNQLINSTYPVIQGIREWIRNPIVGEDDGEF